MKLITKQLEKTIPKLYSTENTPTQEKKVYIHYFIPLLNWDWWICEYDKEEKLFFGYANLNDPQNAEWGYVSLTELEDISEAYPACQVERELNFQPTIISQIQHESLKPLTEGY